MKFSRRPASWRFVAMMVVLLLSAATGAFAQTRQLRVKTGPANVYERPRTSSDVVMVAQEGTVLEILGQEETWYWVLLPPDGNGQRRAGYIAVYLTELISPTGPDVKPRTSVPAPGSRELAVKPESAGPRMARYFASIGGGGQSASRPFADTVRYPQYDDIAQFQATYAPPRASAFDATLGLHLTRRFVLAVAFWHSASTHPASIDASIPSWLAYAAPPRAASATMSVGTTENDGHLQLTWLVPLSSRADLSIFGGPSLFYVQQQLVSAPLTLLETYPFDSVGIVPTATVSKSKATIGANAGFDVTVMVWRYFGVGMSARYARGWMKMASAYVGTIDMQVGGAQISGGVRVRF